MSCYDLYPSSACGVLRPQPLADSGNEPCVRQCPDSTTVIQPPPVVVTFPGPILSSFPQDSVVGSAGAPVLGASGAFPGLWGSGGLRGYTGAMGFSMLWGLRILGYGGLWGFGSGYCSPYSWYGRYGRGGCWSC
uniref:Keratin n=1 Tax=Malurus cyaneus samueli TaxID=2593467 RepID=A0A8C5UKN7_9PASS